MPAKKAAKTPAKWAGTGKAPPRPKKAAKWAGNKGYNAGRGTAPDMLNMTVDQYRAAEAAGAFKKKPVRVKTKTKGILFALIRASAQAAGFTVMEEYKFHKVRRWRFDWFIPEINLAIEYNGLALHGAEFSRHQSITGQSNDLEKLNAAQAMGIKVFQYTALNYRHFSKDFKELAAGR